MSDNLHTSTCNHPKLAEGVPVTLATALAHAGQELTALGGVPLPTPDPNIDNLLTAAWHVRDAHDQLMRALAALARIHADHPAKAFADQEFIALTALKNRAAGVVEAMENRGVTP